MATCEFDDEAGTSAPARQRALPPLARLGAGAIDFLAEAGATVTLAAAVAAGGGRLFLGRARVRAVDFVTYSGSIPSVSLPSAKTPGHYLTERR
jgi:hypothetical protein